MIYVFISYTFSPMFGTPEDWFKRTEGYSGVLEWLSKENTVINIKQINYEGNHNHKGVEYRFVNFGNQTTYFPYRLSQYVKSLNPDVVFIHGLHYPLQLILLRYILNKTTKIIAQHHAERPFTGIKKYVQKISDRYIDAYLFASRAIGVDWVNKGNLASCKKIHEVMEVSSLFYPVDKARAKAKTGVTGYPAFLWVGRLNENKDPINVVSTFLEFNNAHPGARLYMIYHTEELLDEIKSLICKHGNKDAVTLVGKIPHDDLLYWFNSTDFIISGSHYEGSGTAVCEAMSCGCIPIVTEIFSFQMITDNGNCGLLYEAGNQAALLSALYRSLTLDVGKKRNKSLEYFEEKLSFEAIAAQINKIAASL